MAIIQANNFKILIASENINFRNILASKLRVENFAVELALGGFHILHLLERQKDIDMIICNENMNDMPAAEVIALVRLNKTKAELPIVFISKSGTEDEIYELILQGANEYVIQTPNFTPIIERAQKYMHLLKGNTA